MTLQESVSVAVPAKEPAVAVPEVIPSVRIACAGAGINILIPFVSDYFFDDPYLSWVPLVMIAVTLVTCSLNAIGVILYSSSYLWSPLPWFLVACAGYYGVGPTIYFFANLESVSYMDAFFLVDMAILRKTCLLNSVGIFVVCLTWRLALTNWPSWVSVKPRPMDSHSLRILGLVFLAIGLPVKYFFILPRDFGLTEFVLPGTIQACGYFTYFATFTLVYLVASARADYWLKVFTFAFVILEIMTQMLLFSKQAILQVLLMIFFGVYAAKATRVVFYSFVSLILVVYILLTPVVGWCRGESQIAGKVGVVERAEILGDYFTRGDRQAMEDTTNVQWGWMRFCTVPMQAFVVDAYDRGNPGESLWLVLYTMIPRFLWPDKPVIGLGQEFNILATGNSYNNTSPGLWGDAYWNGGWIATVVVCLYIGALHAILTRIVVPSMKVQDFRVLPLAFFGLLMGMRVEDFFVLGCVAPVPICFTYYLVISKIC